MERLLTILSIAYFITSCSAQHLPVHLSTIVSLEFDSVNAITTGPTGNLIITDNAIWDVNIKVDPPSKTLIAGSNVRGHDEGIGADAQFSFPSDVILFNQTHLLVADSGNYCVRLVNLRKKRTARHAGKCSRRGFIDGERFEARFKEPTGMMKFEDLIYIVDGVLNQAIRVLTADEVTTLFSTPQLGTGKYLTGLTADHIFVTISHGIIELQLNEDNSKNFQMITGASVEDFADGTLASSRYDTPTGITMLNNHTLAVVDNRNNRLRIVDLKSDTVSSICSGQAEYTDGNRIHCAFNGIWNIHVYENVVLIADQNKIRTLPLHSLIEDPDYVSPTTEPTATSRFKTASPQLTAMASTKRTPLAGKLTTASVPKQKAKASKSKADEGTASPTTTATPLIILLATAICLL